ncbi:cupin domain-containing protein [Streptomyces erythrochromogenes]|uniref:cupin domain-containing protein n=1 Tax=Streptomyces erythrochromogenes TaxID=285574 RepID=UPI0036741DED
MSPHPEGGWYKETWRSDTIVRPGDYPGSRSACTAIYFLLPPGEESRWHTVRSPELWLWHSGSALHLQLGGTGDVPSHRPSTLLLGPDIGNGQRPQGLVPAGCWQSARSEGNEEVLVSCVVSPGFHPDDFHLLPDNR